MPSARRSTSGWSIWRLLKWGAAFVAFIVVAPVLTWFVANRFDESPSAEALDYAAESPRRVPDATNAWLVLAGIGAAADADPRVLGRQRVDAVTARFRQSPMPAPDAVERELFEDVLPHVGPDEAIDGIGSLCSFRDTNCIEWARANTPALARLEAANAVRLGRWRKALAMPDWQALYPPMVDGPIVDTAVVSLHTNLLALELARTLPFMPANGTLIVSDEPTTLEQLADVADFWRRVLGHPQDLTSTLIAARQLEAAHRLADQWLGWRRASAGPREEAALDRILAAPVGAIDWHEAMRQEFQMFAKTMDDGVPGPGGALVGCFRGANKDGCVKSVAMNSAYARQATLNLHARHRRLMEDLLEAEPRQIEAAHEAAGPAFEETFIQLGDTWAIAHQFAYNPTGRILAQIAIPAFDWGRRVHDQEALRRMIVLKRRAIEQRLLMAEMPAFLEAQPDSLRNPFTGEPFSYAADTGDIHFTPSARSYWPGGTLRVIYPELAIE